LQDPFAGIMKGVVLGICPEARIVDLAHEVPAYEIPDAAFLLHQSWPYFPKGTIHVVVVDPGVGSARRPILVEAAGHRFIGPDNGVFSMLAAPKVRHITAERYFRHPISRTFHGRDIFAPAAAHLAAGITPAKLGPLIHDHIRLTFHEPVRTGRRVWTGAVLHIDRFGNLITNLAAAEFPADAELSVGLETVHRRAATYAEIPYGELFLIAGSSGYLEVSANQTSAAKLLGVGTGAPVELRLL
jgi:hypothetical protein